MNSEASLKRPDSLYKYKKFDEKTISLIVNSKIYFCKADQFNDPFDCKLRYNYEGPEAEWRTVLKGMLQRSYPNLSESQVTQLVDTKIREGAHLDMRSLDQMDDIVGRQQIERTGIFCLTATPTNILMWSHYTDSHKGCCLEFSTSTAPFNSAQNVKYLPEYPALRFIELLRTSMSTLV